MYKKLGLAVILLAVMTMLGASLASACGNRGIGFHLNATLTEEQLETIQNTISEMKEAGASRQEIRDAVSAALEEMGIELPKRGLGLTDEQRDAVKSLVTEMKEAGALGIEIRIAVIEYLRSEGIEIPDQCPLASLTDEQIADIKAKTAEMRDAGSSEEEIWAAVAAMLEEWGIVEFTDMPKCKFNFGKGRFGWIGAKVGPRWIGKFKPCKPDGEEVAEEANAYIADLAVIDADIDADAQMAPVEPQAGTPSTTWGSVKSSQ